MKFYDYCDYFLLINNCRLNNFVLLCELGFVLLFFFLSLSLQNRKLITVVGLNEKTELGTADIYKLLKSLYWIVGYCCGAWIKRQKLIQSGNQEKDYILYEWKSYGLRNEFVCVYVFIICIVAHMDFNWMFLNYLSILIICTHFNWFNVGWNLLRLWFHSKYM